MTPEVIRIHTQNTAESPDLFSPKIRKAHQLAASVFEGRVGKVMGEPAMEHSLEVYQIVSRVSEDEDVLAAALLHDVVEDCDPYGSITAETISQEFGERVGVMVGNLSEDKKLPYEERKSQALSHIPEMDEGSVTIKLADIINNMQRTKKAYAEMGEKVFDKFNAGKYVQRERYRKIIQSVGEHHSSNPLYLTARVVYGGYLVFTNS